MYKSIVCGLLLSSSVFAGSFDYSYMMTRKGYFQSESGGYWSLVKPTEFSSTEFTINECKQLNDTLFCQEYYVDCKNGLIRFDTRTSDVYIIGVKRALEELPAIRKEKTFEGKIKTILNEYDCSYGLFGLECNNYDIAITTNSFEAELCNELGGE